MIDDITALANQAALKAQARWEQAQPCKDHPALNGLPPGDLRLDGDDLLMPLRNLAGEVRALEITGPDGETYPWPKGCKTRGCFFLMGDKTDGGPICICRGWNSGVAIKSVTGHPVHITLGETGLPSVAKALREKYPDRKIIIFGDCDPQPDGTDQCRATAIKAAKAVGGLAVFPTLPGKSDFWAEWNKVGAGSIAALLAAAGAPATKKTIVALDIATFLQKEFPPRVNLLSPWLPAQGLTMVYAYRGIGKTFFALSVAYAVVSGGSYLGWDAPAPAGVLYLDGEMPGPLMQMRLAQIVRGFEKEATAPLIIVNPDLQPDGMPRIDTEEGQAAIETLLTDEIKLIVVDNISTLSGAKENEGDAWTPIQGWALKQRAAGRSVLFVHHSGKGGAQRGTSRREDVLDTVIALRRPAEYQPDQGAVFEIHFEKNRGLFGDEVRPIEASLSTDEHGAIAWQTRTVDDSTFDKVVALLGEDLKQADIADELGLNKSTVSRHAKKAKAMGLLTGGAK